MLDINFIRENPELIRENEKRRSKDPKIVDQVLQYDQQWKSALKKIEQLKHLRNTVSEEINTAKKAKKEKEAQQKILEMKKVAEQIKQLEEEVQGLLQKRDAIAQKLGNIIHPKVPAGKDDTENVEIKTWGKKPTFPFPIKNHVELAENLDIVHFEASAKTSGNGFYFLKGKLGLLNQALIRFALDFMEKKK